ncbi:zinc finger CCCH domain-containing protein 44-like isoform X2 [Actinidia eriantha]|uniref:zinc finger CCCH domain-containing protein 44-like isoform X2 n=1 Tax=Actinidia eriantha TaxID=165200 RepID=UPI00258B78F4|nr:zinc finger CCCH domain-containing protein 44-like isoform X2 [Actinidia eriantha]
MPNMEVEDRIDEMDDSKLVGVQAAAAADSVAGVEKDPAAVEVKVVEKRKRGRPPKGQAKPPPAKKMKEDEDVCFICFDGGSLVLCDRRGCPKAYHPACIKRDEAFFRSKAKWNCGWHICSSCQKAAHYMCYTCTYSLCKACTKDADYLCVRENKGFCATCMKTIMLIENNDQGNKEMVQVDFDDKSSWEYLFKVYWTVLKGELSLTLDELTQAQNPWKAAGTVACKAKSVDIHYGSNFGKDSISDSSSGHLEANNSERRTRGQRMLHKKGDSLRADKSISDSDNISVESKDWASKELLELVANMKNGDTSALSQFDVQALLLDYIKRNNLRDPHQKSHIICDSRLRNLFGKPRVGHFEMLKLLEFHCLTKEDSRKEVDQDNIDAVVSKVDGDENSDNLLMIGKHEKHKTRRKGDEKGPQTNLDEYAAIDVHNINLIYLRRNLMESLTLDNEKFHDKVAGSFVRIRISSSGQNQEMHRLVQVVGTCKAEVPYKIGERTVDFMLEVLNLDKKETLSIDTVSSEEFSEDECQGLRQSIKCGLVKRLTVGQVQEKAMALQEVRLNYWLETEIMRLSHLRDRASEKGHKREHRECVEKLELLKSPEERQRRLHEIPEVHADPNMDPNCESDKDPGVNCNMKQDELAKSRYSGSGRNGREPISSCSDISNHSSGRVYKKLTTSDQSKSMSSSVCLDKGSPNRVPERANEPLQNEVKDACGSNTFEKPGDRVSSSGEVVGSWNNQAGLGSEPSGASLYTESAPSVSDFETYKLWHYRDPNGNMQGPFCVLELRKWSTTGYFPPDMRVWSINDKEGESLLMTDVLNGRFCNLLPMQYIDSLFEEVKGASDSSSYNFDGRGSGSMNTTGIEGKQSVPNNEDIQTHCCPQCSDSLNVKDSYSDQPQVHCPVPSFACTEQPHENSLHQARGHEGQRCNSDSNHGNIMYQTTDGQSHEKQYPGESRKSLPVNYASKTWNSNSGFASTTKSTDSSQQKFGIDFPSLPNPIPKTSIGGFEGQPTKNQQSLPSDKFVQDLNIQNLPSPPSQPSEEDEKADSSIHNMPSPLPKMVDKDEKVQATEHKQSVSSNFPVQDSGPRWSSASSLVVGVGTQHPETADKFGGYSSTSAKPSVEEWDSGLLSLSSLKPPEVAADHAPAPNRNELGPPSPSLPTSSWLAMVTEPIEFSTLAEESVSDLLAEVDAMESEGGLRSPTSVNRGEELFHDSKTECFTSLGGLVPPIESGKDHALSSMRDDLQLPPNSTIMDELFGASSQADAIESGKSRALSSMRVDIQLPQPTVTDKLLGSSSQAAVLDLDPVKRSGRQSSTSMEVEVKTKSTDIPVTQLKSGSKGQLPASSTTSRETIDTVTSTRDRAKPIDACSSDGDGGGTTQENTSMRRGTGQGSERGNASTNRGTSAGYTGRENHPKYGGEKHLSPRDRGFQSRDSGHSKGRPSWSRSSSFGVGGSGSGSGSGGGSGSYSRPPPPRGPRVCKFYESGRCKKGAYCDYLHP